MLPIQFVRLLVLSFVRLFFCLLKTIAFLGSYERKREGEEVGRDKQFLFEKKLQGWRRGVN